MAGSAARAAAPGGSARSSSATTTTPARSATPAASARASTTGSSTGSAGCSPSAPRPDSPFEGRQPPKLTHFVDPDLVASVDFSQWTTANTLRQPSYKGLRDDVPPEEVRGPAEDELP